MLSHSVVSATSRRMCTVWQSRLPLSASQLGGIINPPSELRVTDIVALARRDGCAIPLSVRPLRVATGQARDSRRALSVLGTARRFLRALVRPPAGLRASARAASSTGPARGCVGGSHKKTESASPVRWRVGQVGREGDIGGRQSRDRRETEPAARSMIARGQRSETGRTSQRWLAFEPLRLERDGRC